MIDKIGLLIAWFVGMALISPILFVSIKEIKELAFFPKKYTIPLMILFIIACLLWTFVFCLVFFIFKY